METFRSSRGKSLGLNLMSSKPTVGMDKTPITGTAIVGSENEGYNSLPRVNGRRKGSEASLKLRASSVSPPSSRAKSLDGDLNERDEVENNFEEKYREENSLKEKEEEEEEENDLTLQTDREETSTPKPTPRPTPNQNQEFVSLLDKKEELEEEVDEYNEEDGDAKTLTLLTNPSSNAAVGFDLKFCQSRKFKNQHIVLITNCRDGEVGSFMARKFLARKCHVIACAPNLSLMSELEDTQCDLMKLDLTNEEAIIEFSKELCHKYPRIDIMVVTPTMDVIGPLADPTLHITSDLDPSTMMYQLNVIGPILLLQSLCSALAVGNLSATISIVTSVLGDRGVAWNGLFSSTMASLAHMAHTLRQELAPLGFSVMVFKSGKDRSLLACNNLTTLSINEDSPYKPCEDFMYQRAYWSTSELKHDADLFSTVLVQTTLNRHLGFHYLMAILFSPLKLILTIWITLLIHLIPESLTKLNYYLSEYNPNWPNSQNEFVVDVDRLSPYWLLSFLPQKLRGWVIWDWLGLGYLNRNQSSKTESKTESEAIVEVNKDDTIHEPKPYRRSAPSKLYLNPENSPRYQNTDSLPNSGNSDSH